MSLNPAQNEAVNTLSGPLLVLAGAGTGKTRVVTVRIAKLIKTGIRPSRILAVTFTNKAAKEMQERVTELLGKGKKERPEVSTFHSLCVRILRRHARRLGYPPKFVIYDRGDQEAAARQALREIRVSEAAMKTGDLLNMISTWKCAGIRATHAGDHIDSDKGLLAAAAYKRYQDTLKSCGAVDFDDLLLLVEELFETCPDVKAEEASRFDHLLIDEYQDTNGSQYRIVKALAEEHRNICVVGDDDQSIYAWRGAEVTHILRFRHDWPGAKVVRLETNYRSTEEIVGWANTLIRFNETRHDKTLRATKRGEPPKIIQFKDGESEAKQVVEHIRERVLTTKRKPRDFAILFRTNEQPRAFEMELRRAKVPYVLLGGQSFFDRKEVRDIIAYLRVLMNPHDDISLLRIMNTPPRGIGQTTARRLMESAAEREISVWSAIPKSLANDRMQNKTARALEDFTGLIGMLQSRLQTASLTETVKRLIGEIDYQNEIDRNYTNVNERETRWASVAEVVNAVAAYSDRDERPSLSGFLQESALATPDFDSGDKESKLDRNAVALMTLHAAKGLEFKEVYMVGMEEGTLPHHRSVGDNEEAIAEERRLCYVGVTRAQLRLTLTLALSRIKWGKPRPTVPSRFLYEITGQTDSENYWKAVHAKQLAEKAAREKRYTRKPGKGRRRA